MRGNNDGYLSQDCGRLMPQLIELSCKNATFISSASAGNTWPEVIVSMRLVQYGFWDFALDIV